MLLRSFNTEAGSSQEIARCALEWNNDGQTQATFNQSNENYLVDRDSVRCSQSLPSII